MLCVDNHKPKMSGVLFRWPAIELGTISPFLSWRNLEVATGYGRAHEPWIDDNKTAHSFNVATLESILAGHKLFGGEVVESVRANEMVARAQADPQRRFVVCSWIDEPPPSQMAALELGRLGNYEDFFDLEIVAGDYEAAGLPEGAKMARGLRGVAVSESPGQNYVSAGLAYGYPIESTLALVLHHRRQAPKPEPYYLAVKEVTTREQAKAGRKSFLVRPRNGVAEPILIEDAIAQTWS